MEFNRNEGNEWKVTEVNGIEWNVTDMKGNEWNVKRWREVY